jgi:arylsulfatase A-like enzyme
MTALDRTGSAQGTTPAQRPNILLIMTDQHRFDVVGAYGNPHVTTPHIDRLAAEGVLFEQCYTPNPVCAPTRASILTGRYAHAHGLWANGVALPAHERLFTRTLADARYDCGLVGKLHIAPCYPDQTERRHDDGFSYFEWAHDPGHASPENAYQRWVERTHPALYAEAVAASAGAGGGASGARQGRSRARFNTMPTEAHYTRWVGEETIRFLRAPAGERDRGNPFFLWTNFFDPHHPFVAPQEYLDRYDVDALPLPVGDAHELASKPPILQEASEKSYAGFVRGFAEHTPAEIREIVRAYYAMVSFVDDEIGRIVATLEEQGLRESTLIVFTSDHGEMLGDHQLLLKGPMMYEGAVHVPLLLNWPGRLPAGERRDGFVSLIDVCATALDAAGLDDLPTSQGMSLLPIARGEVSGRDYALCEYRNSGHPYDPPVHVTMLRQGTHKLIVHHGRPAADRDRTGELFDLAADPDELRNLWDAPEGREQRTALQERLLDVLVATEDRSPAREAYW